MAAISGSTVAASKSLAKASEPSTHRALKPTRLNYPWKLRRSAPLQTGCRIHTRPVYAVPDRISEKVVESIKNAEETCSEDPASGECAAAWDEVEELSAAASHARDRMNHSDPLETFCKENPETEECRTYED